MHTRCRWVPLATSLLLLGLPAVAEAIGITAVTRRTVMGGVQSVAPAQSAPGNNGTSVVSPQPAAAAAMFLPGQTPLAVGGKPGTAGARGVPVAANRIVMQPVLVRPTAVPVARRIVPIRPVNAVTAVAPQSPTSSASAPSVLK